MATHETRPATHHDDGRSAPPPRTREDRRRRARELEEAGRARRRVSLRVAQAITDRLRREGDR